MLRILRNSTPLRLVLTLALLLGAELAFLHFNQTAAAAQTDTIGPLTVSKGRTADNQPIEPATGFVPLPEVWVTFDYNLPPGARLSRIVRFDGADVLFGDIPAPTQLPTGRYGFRIGATPPNDLAEGGWEVIVFVNGVEVGRTGFAILSVPGSDTSGGTGNGNGNGNDNGNDNN